MAWAEWADTRLSCLLRRALLVQEELLRDAKAMAEQLHKSLPGIHVPPLDVMCCSAKDNVGVDNLAESIRDILALDGPSYHDISDDVVDWDTSLPDA